MSGKKVHRSFARPGALCGRGGASPKLTPINKRVTCGLCLQVMHSSWGVPLPPGVEPRKAGRKPRPLRYTNIDSKTISFETIEEAETHLGVLEARITAMQDAQFSKSAERWSHDYFVRFEARLDKINAEHCGLEHQIAAWREESPEEHQA